MDTEDWLPYFYGGAVCAAGTTVAIFRGKHHFQVYMEKQNNLSIYKSQGWAFSTVLTGPFTFYFLSKANYLLTKDFCHKDKQEKNRLLESLREQNAENFRRYSDGRSIPRAEK